jgi:hypothetical protein
MSELNFHPGCLILCPGCGGEVHASENDGPPVFSFRCKGCRVRHLDMLRINHPEAFEAAVKRQSNEESNDNVSDRPANPRRRPSGDSSAQQKPPA